MQHLAIQLQDAYMVYSENEREKEPKLFQLSRKKKKLNAHFLSCSQKWNGMQVICSCNKLIT